MRAHVAQDGDEVDGGSIVAVEHKGPWLALLITARAVAVVTLLRAQIPLANKRSRAQAPRAQLRGVRLVKHDDQELVREQADQQRNGAVRAPRDCDPMQSAPSTNTMPQPG